MLVNEKTALSSSRVLLVPYSKHHVPRYHEWMKDPVIQQATASEPLTIEEEYAMQTSWQTDADKLTFIICLPLGESLSSSSLPSGIVNVTEAAAADVKANQPAESLSTTTILTSPNIDAPESMLGDVNMFLRLEQEEEDDNDEADDQRPASAAGSAKVVGEIELMIAEKGDQGKGFGRAGLVCFLKYIADHEVDIVGPFVSTLSFSSASTPTFGTVATSNWKEKGDASIGNKLAYLSAKIGADNVRSLALFESLGFAKVSEKPNVFGEVELRRGGLGRDEGEELLRRYGVEGYRVVGYER